MAGYAPAPFVDPEAAGPRGSEGVPETPQDAPELARQPEPSRAPGLSQ